MIIQGQAGALPSTRQSAGTPNVPSGSFGEILDSRLNPDFYQLVKSGRVFQVGATNVSPSAFTGGASGTPLVGLYNPVSSGVDLVVIQARVGIRTTGSSAATLDFNFWGTNQGGTALSGTQTISRNLYSLATAGAVAYSMVNTTNSGALTSTLLLPSVSLGAVASAAAPNVGVFVDNVNGALIVAPGCYIAYGASASLTSGQVDCSLVWAEIPA